MSDGRSGDPENRPSERNLTEREPRHGGHKRQKAVSVLGNLGSETNAPQQNQFIERMKSLFGISEQDSASSSNVLRSAETAVEAKRQMPEVTFSDALDVARLISRIRDEKELHINTDDIEKFKRIVMATGILSEDEVLEMKHQELVAATQFAILSVKVAEPKDSDFKYGGKQERILEEAEAKEVIGKVQSLDEEILTPEKINELVTFQGEVFGREAKGGGPGAEEVDDTGEDNVVEMPRRRRGKHIQEDEQRTKEAVDSLMSLKKQGQTTGAQWEQSNLALDQRLSQAESELDIERPSYKKVYFTHKAVKRAIAEYKDGLPDDIRERFLRFVDEKDGALARISRKLREAYTEMAKSEQDDLVGDIERQATSYYKQIVSGFGVTIEEAKELTLAGEMIGDDPTGLREWRAVNLAEGFDNAVRVNQLFETPVIWEEVPEKIGAIYSFVESTDLSVEDMQTTIQQAIIMIRNIAPDTAEGRAVRERLVKDLEAFRAFHSMRITMERNDMNPKEMIGVFQTYFGDETWVTFSRRFSTDNQGRVFVDKEGQEINPLDVSFEIYSERLRDERVLMNMVEEMTKYSIANKFGGATISEMKRAVGFNRLPKMWQAKWEDELEKLRQYFVRKLNDKQLKDKDISVDDWGKKKSKVMKELIGNWHTKRTLHGAFWRVGEDDLPDLMEEFGVTDKNEGRERFLGAEFLAIRREQNLRELIKRLGGLKVKIGDGVDAEPREVDLGDLEQLGFLGSVDYNSYNLTWMFEWSNYDNIRIYNRESRSHLDDDFDDIVFHQSTHLFYARHVDHIWEFYHDENENRGRAKENDVNRIWKQYLPGKHHYLFPQNSLMVRWADNFMTKGQQKDLGERIKRLMQDWDFDNEKYHDEYLGWMKSVALMDMIENGELVFGQGDFRFSKIASKLRKFEMIDVYADRNKHLEYAGPQAFQGYLANPTDGKFIDINDKEKVFYSTRAARQFPWMTLALRAHWEIANKHRLRLFDDPNATSAEGERLIDGLVARGDMERKAGDKEERNLLGYKELKLGGSWGLPVVGEITFGDLFGTAPFRRMRQLSEFFRRGMWDSKFLPAGVSVAALWVAIIEFFKQIPKETQRQ